MGRVLRRISAIGVGALLVSGVGISAAEAAPTDRVLPWFPGSEGPTVLTSGLNNPRQIQLVNGDGVLLIAEAGKGGTDCIGEGEEAQCVGATGAVSTVIAPQFGHNRSARDVVSGLLSFSGPDGSFAVGSDGASARSLGRIKVIVTAGAPDLPPTVPAEQGGKLLDRATVRSDQRASRRDGATSMRTTPTVKASSRTRIQFSRFGAARSSPTPPATRSCR